MEIQGEHTTAEVKLPEEHIEEGLEAEIQEQVNHEAFQNPIKYMPDVHGGLGPSCIVGFSMSLGNRVVPNTVGGDIGCGMTAARIETHSRLSDVPYEEGEAQEINRQVRRDVPMGTGRVHDDPIIEMEWDFPWYQANEKLLNLLNHRGRRKDFEAYRFDMDYYEELCQRVGISESYAERSLGTLGSGNHFIEVARSDEDYTAWVVIHSGSRNLGQKVASYWQEKASNHRDKDVKWDEMNHMERMYAKSDGTPNWEKIRRQFDGEMIEIVGDGIQEKNPDDNRNRRLDYLEGAEMFGYLRDMIFAQTYAAFNRRVMARKVAEILDAQVHEVIDSPHNYVDFEDGVIRKGSTRAHQDERFVIPMNMEDGTLLCRGKGNPEWNRSAPHGAGRLGSRGWARDEFDAGEVKNRMIQNGTFSAHVPGDEVPEAYKPVSLIEREIQPTAEVVDRLKPMLNFKA